MRLSKQGSQKHPSLVPSITTGPFWAHQQGDSVDETPQKKGAVQDEQRVNMSDYMPSSSCSSELEYSPVTAKRERSEP